MADVLVETRKPTVVVNPPDKALTTFGCLLAIAICFHIASFINRHHAFNDFVLAAAAVWLLSRPSSLPRFLLLVSCQLYVVAVSLPFVSNHWLLLGCVSFTILLSYGLLASRRKTFSVDKRELYDTFAPVLRIELLILYFYVVFHKLNTDFLTPGISCGSEFYTAQSNASLLPASEWLATGTIYVTLLVEAAIPLLLIFRRTVLLGVLIGVVFHAIIAYNPLQPFYDFSSAVFALYFLFIPPSVMSKTIAFWRQSGLFQRLKQFQQLAYSRRSLLMIGLLSVLGFGTLFVLSKLFTDFFRYILWTAYSLLYVGFILTALLVKRQRETLANRFRVSYAALWLMPVVVLLNGACPYLGLKTESSFAMFSNLRTEGGVTNHLLIPASVQPFGFQRDMIEIISSSDAGMQRLAKEERLITFFELRRYVDSHKPFSVSFIRQGKRVDVPNTAGSEVFAQPLPILLRKLFYFRTINKQDPQPCSH